MTSGVSSARSVRRVQVELGVRTHARRSRVSGVGVGSSVTVAVGETVAGFGLAVGVGDFEFDVGDNVGVSLNEIVFVPLGIGEGVSDIVGITLEVLVEVVVK